MKQTPQATSSQQAASDRWAQVGNGLWLPKQGVPQVPITSTSQQKRRRHIRQSFAKSASQQKIPQRPPWPQRHVAGKTLWDWMSLLLIPLLVGMGTIWVTNRQTDAQNALSEQLHQSDQAQYQQDEKRAQQTRWDDLLREYQDGIDALLLSHGLRQAHPGDEVSEIAHAQTINVLKTIDASRRGLVIRYLSNLKLIQRGFWDAEGVWHKQERIVSLRGTDLIGADLTNTYLDGADLTDAYLDEADLTDAYLDGTDLSGAELSDADLTGVDLSDADLSRAYIEENQLRRTDSLSGATLPNGWVCQKIPHANQQIDLEKFAKNRDECLRSF